MPNVFELVRSAADRFPDKTAVEVFRRSGVETYTYRQLAAMAGSAARALTAHGVGRGSRCAILADNDARWCGAYLGVLSLGAVAVPLDTAYKAPQVATIAGDAGARVLLTTEKYADTAREAAHTMATAPDVVLFAELEPDVTALVVEGPPTSPATAADPALILYTSGTTSDPKGVVLTHGNLLAERDAALTIVKIDERDRILGILPLFHALAQVANLLLPLTIGARVVFLETVNSSEMMRALQERGISALCIVPQFFYLMHQRVNEQVAARSGLARGLFRAMKAVNGSLRRRLRINAGRLLFPAVHRALGGHMRIMVTGGSRFDPAIGRDMYAMGLNIVQAYGLTECSGGATLTRPGDPHLESVGQPLKGVEVRILDEPDDAIEREHPDGEVLIKGPIVMAGYHNRPDVTAAALQDGWLHTGDLGYLDGGGRLHITGRKKEMIVLSSGKNIYPEEIEAVYGKSPWIAEICVLGVARPDDPSSERLHAIVVPNFELMRERGVVNTREIVRFDIEGLSLRLPHHKRVLSFDIWREALPRTTTRKLKRHEIERMYRASAIEQQQAVAEPEWGDEDRAWASDPHASGALETIRAAAKPGAVVRPDANLELDLGLDSMERVELLARVEDQSGTRVTPDVAAGVYTVRELIEATRPGVGTAAAGAGPAPDPWKQILERDIDDPVVAAVLDPKPVFTLVMFAAIKCVYAIAWLLLGLRVHGRDNIPRQGGYIVSPNHQGYVDPFILVASLPFHVFRRLFFVGASEYFMTPLMAKVARLINVVPVDPDTNLVRAMQAGAFGLRHGKVLVLFPEGERSPDGTPRVFKKGAAILAAQLGVPIVPVAIHGAFEVWPRGSGPNWGTLLPWARTRTALRFGPPIDAGAAATGATAGEGRYAALTDRLRRDVVSMWTDLGKRA